MGGPPDGLTWEALAALAGPRTMARGQGYAYEGRVRDLQAADGTATAVVRGAKPYRVRLDVTQRGLAATCDCPAAAESDCCKHAVALGVAWLGEDRRDRDDTVRRYLRSRGTDWLVERVLDLASRDEAALLRLEAEAGAAAGDLDLAAMRGLLSEAIAVDDYLRWDEAGSHADGIHATLDVLEALITAGRADAAVGLIEHAMAEMELTLERVDDSDGHLGGVSERLRELHLAACTAARPDPVELARRLVQIELSSDWEWFHGAPERYAHVLGAAGLTELRRALEGPWSRLRPLGPGDEQARFDRYAVTALMESLARAVGDVDALVEIKARDLASADGFLDIGQTLADAGRAGEALHWVERGLAAFGPGDGRLRALAVELLRGAGRGAEAVDLVWRAFELSPGALLYQELREVAAEDPDWPERRAAALALLRSRHRREPFGSTELVRALLSDGEVDEAWRAAVTGGCTEPVWLELAERRSADHPDDALSVYRNALATQLQTTGERSYARAVKLLAAIRRILVASGRPDAFVAEARLVREANRRRPKLVAMLDAQGWW